MYEMSQDSLAVFARASYLARKFGFSEISTELLLLAMLDCTGSPAHKLIQQMDLEERYMRSELTTAWEVVVAEPKTDEILPKDGSVHQTIAEAVAQMDRFAMVGPITSEFLLLGISFSMTYRAAELLLHMDAAPDRILQQLVVLISSEEIHSTKT